STGILVTDQMYKHCDEWVSTAPHPFVADFDGNGISNIVDILNGEPYESPMKPWGGIEQLAWNTTSDKVAYTCRKKTGLEYAISTNSDIYVYDLNTQKTENITEENKGYDTNPQYSPDGKYIAWQSMERDGYEADLNRLFIMNLETGEKRFVSKAFESNVDAFVWGTDAKTIYFTGVWHGESQIYALDLATDSVKAITSGMYDYEGVALLGDKLIAKRHSMSMGDELYTVALDGSTTQLTQENKQIYDQLEMGKVEGRWMKTTDGKQMLTWVIYPPQFDPNKKYPTLLFCEGGPQSPVSQFWSYRWNFQIMAANDYIIVAPNRRGLPGFGVEWNEQISGDYGGQCMKDYFTAIDEIAKEPYVDKDRLGCVGASFGGFSVYWLAGHHDKRFKAFIAHDGIFNMEMQYLETEEKWFANWDMGGAYWEKQNPVAQRTFANSPHLFVEKWDTPILCIHGEKDYRILANQAMAAFDAAVMRGIPAELLIYPDENHWVLKPQNGVLWQRTFFEWLDKWVKKTPSK
ncbi:MAG: prolyl oligopeptidase family serine peptidase, partial [Bacteroides acidifaciens]